jgi:3D (Asp-Asp-Asp) domain-containing protein
MLLFKRLCATVFFALIVISLSACGTTPTEIAITPGGPTRTAPVVDSPTATILPTPSNLLKISASGFSQKGNTVEYAFLIKNLSPSMAAENVGYIVTASDQNGVVLGTEEGSIGVLLPDQELGFSSNIRIAGDQTAAKIEVLQTGVEFSNTETVPAITLEPATLYSNETGSFATSLITNPYDHKLTNLKIYAVAYNAAGDIIGGGADTISIILAKTSSGVQVKLIETGDVARVDLYAGLPNLAAANPTYDTPAGTELIVQEYGFGQLAEKGSYGILFKSPSTLDFLEGSRFHVTAYSADGKVLAAGNGSVPVILPGQSFGVGGPFDLAAGMTIDHIEIQVLTGEYLNGDPKLKFPFESLVYVPGTPGKVTATFINPYANIPFQRMRVYAIARDAGGKIVGGGSITLDSVAAGSKTPVEITISTSATVAKVELFASTRKLEELK